MWLAGHVKHSCLRCYIDAAGRGSRDGKGNRSKEFPHANAATRRDWISRHHPQTGFSGTQSLREHKETATAADKEAGCTERIIIYSTNLTAERAAVYNTDPTELTTCQPSAEFC